MLTRAALGARWNRAGGRGEEEANSSHAGSGSMLAWVTRTPDVLVPTPATLPPTGSGSEFPESSRTPPPPWECRDTPSLSPPPDFPLPAARNALSWVPGHARADPEPKNTFPRVQRALR